MLEHGPIVLEAGRPIRPTPSALGARPWAHGAPLADAPSRGRTVRRITWVVNLEVESPYDGRVVASLPLDDEAQVSEKIAKAREAFAVWRDVPVGERKAAVERAVAWFRTHAEEVARDVTAQMGKPIVQSRREVETMLERAEHMLAICESSLAPDVLPEAPGLVRRIEHRPLGVVLDVAAWNYPLLIAVNVVVPAVLAGNAVLVKHSAKTPLCGRHFVRAFEGVGPDGLVQDLVATHAVTATAVRDRRIDYVAFTGSVRGGLEVYATAATRCVDVGLELGGKDPAYVAPDADLDFAVENVVDGACYNAGQSCCAVERVYVHRRIYDAFVEKARAVLERYVLGDPNDEATTMGPLASATAPAFLANQCKDALDRGARLLLGGRPSDAHPRFFPPTLLADVPQDARVMQEESFGPILPVAPVDDDDEALARMNDSRYGLTASVWTRDPERAETMARRLEAGTIYMNRCDVLDPALPWTGAKDSGIGSTLSRYGFLHLTRRTSINFRTQP